MPRIYLAIETDIDLAEHAASPASSYNDGEDDVMNDADGDAEPYENDSDDSRDKDSDADEDDDDADADADAENDADAEGDMDADGENENEGEGDAEDNDDGSDSLQPATRLHAKELTALTPVQTIPQPPPAANSLAPPQAHHGPSLPYGPARRPPSLTISFPTLPRRTLHRSMLFVRHRV